MNPKITIITVCYNSEETILRTIESVASQNYDNLEYIIIDGKSRDKTVDIIESFREKTGLPSILISEKDSGIYDAMNKGIKNATGDIVCMLNSDDWLELNALKLVAENYHLGEETVIYGMERRIKNGIEEIVGFHSHNYLCEGNIPHQTCYVPLDCYRKYGGYDTKYKSAADYDFMLRLAENGVQFKPLYKILANFSVGGMSAGAIGYIEEAAIKYTHGLISKKRYWYLIIRANFLKLTGQLK